MRLVLAAACAALAAGCSLVKVHEQSQEFYDSAVLVGRVSAPPEWRGAVAVAARSIQTGAVVHDVLLHEPGGFELIVPRGRYELLAYGDANGNRRFDRGEPAARHPGEIAVEAPGLVGGLDLALDPAAGIDRAIPFSARRSTQVGAPLAWDDPAFSGEAGRKGYWEPMAAFREWGGNVHFLEPYDPARTPVLFVHGAGGSALDWKPLAERLDRSRYQAWIFQYPSGAPVDSMAHLLYWKLINLQVRYRFGTLHVVAHSMGGLVARRFLLDHGAQFPQVRLFVSLSTPWAGEPLAELGVQRSPAVVPSWRDMQPDGPFMRALFERPLPPGIDYYLFFGHRGGYSLVRPNNDGAVTLASQLRAPAQAEARMVQGFDEDHVGILSSASVAGQLAALMDRADRRSASEAARSGAVRLRLALEGGRAAAALPTLMLVPRGGGDRAYLALEADDDGREISPIASGEYDASIVADGWATQPARHRVVVAAGEAPTLRFRLAPQGTLTGFVSLRKDPLSNPPGRLATADAALRITALELEGEALRRRLEPERLEAAALADRYLDGRDAAAGNYFSFVGLPAGDYRLTVHSEGRAPHVSRHSVVPGLSASMRPIELP